MVLLSQKLIADLRKRTLAEYSVLMTLYAVGAMIGSMLIALVLETLLAGYALFAAVAILWLFAMGYLWLHFYFAVRDTQLDSSATGLFHKIQCVAFAFAAIPLFVWRTSNIARLLFSTISFGVEAALTAFFVCHIFLAATLCQRFPRMALIGLVLSSTGLYFSYQHLIEL